MQFWTCSEVAFKQICRCPLSQICIAAMQLRRYVSGIHSTNSIMIILSLSCSKKHKAESRQGQYNRPAQGVHLYAYLWGLHQGGCLHFAHCDTWCHVQAHHQSGLAAWYWTSKTASVLPGIYKHHPVMIAGKRKLFPPVSFCKYHRETKINQQTLYTEKVGKLSM